MLTVTTCPPDDPAFLALVDEMTAELVILYGLAPDARPAPLTAGATHLLSRDHTGPTGCCAVQPVAPGLCELKRMFVRPAVRGTGLATRLLRHAERIARDLGATRLRLETGAKQLAAIRLYEGAGYRAIEKYPPHDSDPLSRCYEKSLIP